MRTSAERAARVARLASTDQASRPSLAGALVRVTDAFLTAAPYALLAVEVLRIWSAGLPDGARVFTRLLPVFLVYEFHLIFYDFFVGSALGVHSRTYRLGAFLIGSLVQGGISFGFSRMFKAPEVMEWFWMLLPWRAWSVIVRDSSGYWPTIGALRAGMFLATALPAFLIFQGHLPLWGLTAEQAVWNDPSISVNGELPDFLFWSVAYCSLIAPLFFSVSLRADRLGPRKNDADARAPTLADWIPVYAFLACLAPSLLERLVRSERLSVASTCLALSATSVMLFGAWAIAAARFMRRRLARDGGGPPADHPPLNA